MEDEPLKHIRRPRLQRRAPVIAPPCATRWGDFWIFSGFGVHFGIQKFTKIAKNEIPMRGQLLSLFFCRFLNPQRSAEALKIINFHVFVVVFF